MESVAGFTVTCPSAVACCAKGDATGFAGASFVPQVAWSGLAAIPPVVRLAWLAATVAVDRWAFTDLAMSRLDFGVAVIFFIAHCLGAFGLVPPVIALAGNAAPSIRTQLCTGRIDSLTRWVGLA